MKALLSSAVAGLVFALGLGLAGMTRPEKVVGFLDLTGDWDPSLAFVMIGAIGAHGAVLLATRGGSAPAFAEAFLRPTRCDVDARLLGGAALFGVGWGLGGYCPGPAVVSVAGGADALLFTAAMLTGMAIHAAIARATRAPSAPVVTGE